VEEQPAQPDIPAEVLVTGASPGAPEPLLTNPQHDMSLLISAAPHVGHTGWSEPITSSSKFLLQVSHLYSYIGISYS
jgi:hypothetical protein